MTYIIITHISTEPDGTSNNVIYNSQFNFDVLANTIFNPELSIEEQDIVLNNGIIINN